MSLQQAAEGGVARAPSSSPPPGYAHWAPLCRLAPICAGAPGDRRDFKVGGQTRGDWAGAVAGG